MTPAAKALRVKTIAGALGLDLVGVTTAAPLDRAGYYRRWLDAGYAGPLTYMTRNVRVRNDPPQLLPGARTIISVAVAYKRSDGFLPLTAPRDSSAIDGTPTGVVAQYARGRDYHYVLRGLLTELVDRLQGELDESFAARILVDTGPLLERAAAARAGLGWIGRNTCLMNAQHGSYLLLGEIVTTLELVPDEPVAERCGRCDRCIRACPTGALVAPYQLDATRCIAALTIEQHAPIAEEYHAAIGDRVFGCDVCQQVCPYNAKAPLGQHPDIMADVIPAHVNLLEIIKMRSGNYRRLTAGTAARRARRSMWQRNAIIALRNARPHADLAPVLSRALTTEDAGVREAAHAAVSRRSLPPPR